MKKPNRGQLEIFVRISIAIFLTNISEIFFYIFLANIYEEFLTKRIYPTIEGRANKHTVNRGHVEMDKLYFVGLMFKQLNDV